MTTCPWMHVPFAEFFFPKQLMFQYCTRWLSCHLVGGSFLYYMYILCRLPFRLFSWPLPRAGTPTNILYKKNLKAQRVWLPCGWHIINHCEVTMLKPHSSHFEWSSYEAGCSHICWWWYWSSFGGKCVCLSLSDIFLPSLCTERVCTLADTRLHPFSSGQGPWTETRV